MKEMLRILIADDHPLIRKGIIQMLKDEFLNFIIGEANNNKELVEQSRKTKWDIIITDLSMPGGSELETIKILRAENPLLPILVLSMLDEGLYAKRALKAGASGYLLKDSAPEELNIAINKIFSGKKYFSEKVAEQLANDIYKGKKDTPFHDLLSDRELEVLKLIATGKSVSEISVILSLSVPTISTYRVRILEKLDLKNTSEIIHFAFRNGVI